jgi:PEP-CTERM motif
MKQHLLALALGAALGSAFCGGAMAAPVSLAGATVTGQVSGAATALLGADSFYQAGPGSNVTAVGGDVEFITDDADPALFIDPALQIDFGADGSVVFYDNRGLGVAGGDYSFSFVFAGLAETLGEVTLDLSGLAGGSVVASITAPHTVSFTVSGASFVDVFGSFSAQLGTAPAPVPVPGTLALAGLGLLGLAGTRRPALRRQQEL